MKIKTFRFLFCVCFLVIFFLAETLISCDDSIDPNVSDEQLPPGFHVTTTGSASGSGTIASPWDLKTALNNSSAVGPGGIIYIHGGTYYGAYVSNLNGTNGNPIVVRPWYDETVIIDSCNAPSGSAETFKFDGSYTHVKGLTITNSNPNHYAASGGLEGVRYFGHHNKLINCIIHDNTGNGIGFWSSAIGSEVAGCIIYHNGTIGEDRGHGHGLYIQNNSNEYKIIRDNIIFNSFGKGAQIYGTEVSIRNVKMINNTIFNSALAASSSIEQGIIAGGVLPVDNMILNNNIFYISPQFNTAASAKFGYENAHNGYGEFKNNVCIDSYLHITKDWDKITTSGNAYISKSSKTKMVFGFDALRFVTTRDYDNNKFYLGQIGENGGSWNGFTLYTLSQIQNNSTVAYRTEQHSTYYSTLPKEDMIVVQPNPYQSGRAHITIHNWTGKTNISVGVGSVLKRGDKYALYDVTCLSGGPIATGKFSGTAIKIPMNLSNVDKPIGLTANLSRFKNTSPDFGVFLLKKL